MEKFIKEHTTLPQAFIDDFYFITSKSHLDTDIVINFEIVAKWLKTEKGHLKEILIKNFDEEYDYTTKKITKKDGAKTNNYIDIKISSLCFKGLCMMSQTAKAKQVRMYFLELEKIVKKYYSVIEEKLLKEIGLLKTNQKKTKYKVGGVIYIIEAHNKADGEKLYKLGKTGNLDKRIKIYNTGNANNVKILFKIYVNDKDSVESCVKKALEKYEYRHNKEVYEIDINMIKVIVKKCDEFADELKRELATYDQRTEKALRRIKAHENQIYMIIQEHDGLNKNRDNMSDFTDTEYSDSSLDDDSDEDEKPKKVIKKKK
jgi:phage anti-repressor protein